jgi:GNAT superfamily N-acetyltransferase
MSTDAIEIRELDRDELGLVREIDRSEEIHALYVQHGTRLELRTEGDWSAPAWSTDGEGEHSMAGQVRALEQLVRDGAIALGAFDRGRLVGIGVALPHLRAGIAQLAYLHVTTRARARGIGGRLSDELEAVAREVGDTSIVVSATPSLNTVRFYRRRGYEPMAEPLPELLEFEPEDIHMVKPL